MQPFGCMSIRPVRGGALGGDRSADARRLRARADGPAAMVGAPLGSTSGLSSLWHRPYQAIRRGCPIHAAGTTWLGHSRRIRGPDRSGRRDHRSRECLRSPGASGAAAGARGGGRLGRGAAGGKRRAADCSSLGRAVVNYTPNGRGYHARHMPRHRGVKSAAGPWRLAGDQAAPTARSGSGYLIRALPSGTLFPPVPAWAAS